MTRRSRPAKTRDAFLERIRDGVHHDAGIDADEVGHAVLALVAAHLPAANSRTPKPRRPRSCARSGRPEQRPRRALRGREAKMPPPKSVRLFLCGDVMTGRGVDQIMAHPSDPVLYEGAMTSAVGYVRLAEAVNGPIARRAPPSYVWGAALDELNAAPARPSRDQSRDQRHALRRPRSQGHQLSHEPGKRRLPDGGGNRLLRPGQQPRARLGPRRPVGHPRHARAPERQDRRRRPRRGRGAQAGDSRIVRRAARAGLLLRVDDQRRPVGLGRARGCARRRSASGPRRTRRRLGGRAGFVVQAAGRCRRRLDPLGLQLGIRSPRRATAVRPCADRQRRAFRSCTAIPRTTPKRSRSTTAA